MVNMNIENDVTTTIENNQTFALALYQQVRSQEGKLFFSPYSICTALAMTYAGARGETARQMETALNFSLGQERLHPAFAAIEKGLNSIQDQGHIQLNVANSLWPQQTYPFLDEFLTLLKQYYGVALEPVDYQTHTEGARQQINAWVAEKTRGKIKDLLKQGVLDTLTRLVLVNAIYFKGDWLRQFDKSLTHNAPFRLNNQESVNAPLMAQTHSFRYAEADQLQILELPYVEHSLSMVVLLPRQIDGLADLEIHLSKENLETWLNRLTQTEVEVFLPRFEMSSEFRLDRVLQALGMTDAFDASKANFAGMDGQEAWLYIAAVIHKAFVEVNEEGTEAAAATAVVINARSAMQPPPTPIFRADHPFVFLIRDNHTGSILFMGRVTNPVQ